MPAHNPGTRSLHWWVSASLVLLALLMFSALTFQGFRSQELIEHQTWRDVLASISASRSTHLSEADDAASFHSGVVRSWTVRRGSPLPKDLPAYLAHLAPGYYSSEREGHLDVGADRFHALVQNTRSGKIITWIDIAAIEEQQNDDALISGVWAALFVAVVGLVIWWLHLNLVRPVRDLADRMLALDPGDIRQRLPTSYRQHEIQVIARATNDHLDRVERLIENERALLDQASHEFRTPVAIISGAVDVLRKHDLPAGALPVIDRIARTTHALSEIMQSLLYLARERRSTAVEGEVVELEHLLLEIVRDHQHLLEGRPVRFKVGRIELTTIRAPEGMARIALSNLIRNAAEHTEIGEISISLLNGGVSIVDSGVGFDAAESAHRYLESLKAGAASRGHGIGLYLVRRICERLGWRLSIMPASRQGTSVHLDISACRIAGVED